MILKRKIEHKLLGWKNTPNHKPLLLKGCRQCGKTFSVLAFAREHYEHSVYLNFIEDPDAVDIFSGSLNPEHLLMMLSAHLGSRGELVPGKTLLILDELQECPRARAALKFFCLDGRFDVIATGSLLGVMGYGTTQISIPVGYESSLLMYPLDFEEFLWAHGVSEDLIDYACTFLRSQIPVPTALHNRWRELLKLYLVVGGMPEVVSAFLESSDLRVVLNLQREIVASYEADMLKYAEQKDKGRIKECFRSIPAQLAQENRKFKFSLLKKGASSEEYTSALSWLEDLGLILRCHNLSITELPFEGYALPAVFKVYLQDSGLFVSMLDDAAQFDLLKGNLYSYKGAVLENLIAGMLSKSGHALFYFRKDSGLELDFLIRCLGEPTILEVKATTGNAKSAKTVLQHPEKYHIKQGIKLTDGNIGRSLNGQMLTVPHYLAAFLDRLPEDWAAPR